MDETVFLFTILVTAITVTAILLFIIARQDKRILERLKRIDGMVSGKAQHKR